MTEIFIDQKIDTKPNHISVFEPVIEKTTNKESVKIRLIQNISDVRSDLWIGFKTQGTVSPGENFASHDRTKAFINCSSDGLSGIDREVLYVDSDQPDNPAFFLLNPPDQATETLWIQRLVKTCVDFKVSHIGIYFDSKLVQKNFDHFLTHVLQQFFNQVALQELYILAFRSDYNLILNAVLNTQNQLDNPNLEFDVYH